MAAISDPWNDVGHKVGVDPVDDAGIDISDLKQGAHLHLGATPSTSADDPAADTQAQRDRSLDNDAENRLEALPPACALASEQPSSEPGSVHSPSDVGPQPLHESCGMLDRQPIGC